MRNWAAAERVLDEAQVGGNDLLVLMVLATYTNERGSAWPGIPRLAEETRLDRSTVRRALRRLETAGEVRTRIQGSQGGSNLYTIALLAGRGNLPSEPYE